MRQTLSKMHRYDMVKMDTGNFEIVCGGGGSVVKALLNR